jgi:hypothetical protein
MSKRLLGSVWQRPNGTWTLQAERTWNPTTRRYTRPSLGTYPTRQEAHQAQTEYTAQTLKGVLSLDETALRRLTVSEYLTDWMALLAEEERVGHIARRTLLDYEQLLVVVNDGTTSPTEGCSPLVGFPAGSIAIVDRGGCEFVIKVGNAQAAGAVAVVVANNVGGDPITMGGVDASITISSVMVSQADGAVIKVGLPATGTVQPAP